MNKTTLSIGAVLLVAIVVGIGSYSYMSAMPQEEYPSAVAMEPTAPPAPTTPLAPIPTAPTTPTVPVSGANTNTGQLPTPSPQSAPVAQKEFIVTGENYSFMPGTITVKKGDKVKITFKNIDGFHDFKLDEFGVATKKISSGQEEVVTFVADKAGTFEYYCSIGSHRAMGMKGAFVVQE